MRVVCIYHGNCMDGFTAAWVVKKFYEESYKENPINIEFVAGVYQRPVNLEQLRGATVVMVDFSYKPEVMFQIAQAADTFLWIDHHKSAILAIEAANYKWPDNFERYLDLDRSGAGLTWDYFFDRKSRPSLIDYVEDRDLWKFKYPETRAINAALFSYEYEFNLWDSFAEELESDILRQSYILSGQAIERKHFKDINELLPICTRHIRIAGHIVPVANLPYTMVSDAGNILAQRNPSLFGICYYDGMDGRNFSLRSVEGGMDVSEIAKEFGGGGHKAAAGFRVSFEKAKEFEIGEIQ